MKQNQKWIKFINKKKSKLSKLIVTQSIKIKKKKKKYFNIKKKKKW